MRGQRGGIDAHFIDGHCVQSRGFIEGLETRPVVEVPVPPGIVDAAGKAIRFVVQGRVQRVGIGSGKRAPVRWRVEKVQRSRRQQRAVCRRSKVIDVEAQLVGGVKRKACRSELPDRRPIMIVGKARREGRGARSLSAARHRRSGSDSNSSVATARGSHRGWFLRPSAPR